MTWIPSKARLRAEASEEGSSGQLHAFRSKAWVRARVERLEVEFLVLDEDGAKEEEPDRGTGGGGDGGAR